MDKQKKRHISSKKFKRVIEMAWDEFTDSPCQLNKDNDKCYFSLVFNGFIYWREDELDGNWQYYRKSLKEVFK